MVPDFTLDIPVSFGHCDPAGIVFYPNYFRWFDRCFHSFLQARACGHKALCARLGARGIGLMDVGASFPAPAAEGDVIALHLWLERWGNRSLRLAYEGRVEARAVVTGHEVRGLFQDRDGIMRAGDMAPLRAALQGGADLSG